MADEKFRTAVVENLQVLQLEVKLLRMVVAALLPHASAEARRSVEEAVTAAQAAPLATKLPMNERQRAIAEGLSIGLAADWLQRARAAPSASDPR